MSRLTWRNPKDGKIYLYAEDADVVGKLAKYEDLEEQCIEENQCGLRELIVKWKAFFDDIAELYDYRKAEEQGLLLMPPVYIGQTVYRINEGAENPIIPMAVTSIQYNGATKPFNKIFCVELGFGDLFEYRFTDIGVTLFRTREEAEVALAEKGGAE